MTFLLDLHSKIEKIEGLLQNFKNVALFEIVVRTGISIQKKKTVFLGTIFVLRRAKFCCVVVLLHFCSYYTAANASGGNIIWRIATFDVLKRSPP